MPPVEQGSGDATLVDIEFDTGNSGGARLGDIASSLVTLDELLRDLASLAAYPSSAEFRKVEIAAIELRSPLKIRLSLLAIAPAAVNAFQEVCRAVILFREPGLDRIRTTLESCVPEGVSAHVGEREVQRIYGHMIALQSAEIRLKRVEVV
jgi:hypothetical protein